MMERWKQLLLRACGKLAERPVPFLLGASFVLWFLLFRPFIFDPQFIISDAQSYRDNTIYFLQELSRGNFPSWSPNTGVVGVPNDLFLRRIGCYNPVYLWGILFHWLGMEWTLAYCLTMAAYFLLGMLGFFLLLKRIYRDDLPAFVGTLTLLFSSLGTRLFDSYMLLVTIPLIWFFYFISAFTQQPCSRYFWGLVLSVMVLMTTYIPFFIIIIISVFFVLFGAVFFSQAGEVLRKYRDFIVLRWWMVLIAAVMLGVSLVPTVQTFRKMQSGSIEMPDRHGVQGGVTAPAGQKAIAPDAGREAPGDILDVNAKRRRSWAIPEDVLFSSYFWDIHRFRPAVLYVPLVAVVLFLLGAGCLVNRRVVFYFSFGLFFIVLGSPWIFPVYDLLYAYVPFFRYFRNLHFFLWFLLIPLFAVVIAEYVHQFLRMRDALSCARTWGRFVLAVHVLLAGIILARGDWVLVTAVTLAASLFFFGRIFLSADQVSRTLVAVVLMALIVLEPIAVYYYLHKNMAHELAVASSRKDALDKNTLTRAAKALALGRLDPGYYNLTCLSLLARKVDAFSIRTYLKNPVVCYDQVKLLDDRVMDLREVARAFRNAENRAFVAVDSILPGEEPLFLTGRRGFSAWPSTGQYSVLERTSDVLRLRTAFSGRKFLVYNDGYDKNWRAYVDGKEVRVYRSNIAFKGVWLSPGDHVVEFIYGDRGPGWLDLALLLFFNLLFYGVLLCGIWDRRKKGRK